MGLKYHLVLLTLEGFEISLGIISIRLSYFSFQPVLHDWCNKGCGMCYPVCGMVHIKEPLLLIDKRSLCGSSRFPFSLSEWSLTICLTPYNRRENVLSVSLNKTFLFLLLALEGFEISLGITIRRV